jgi:hypothetical protein
LSSTIKFGIFETRRISSGVKPPERLAENNVHRAKSSRISGRDPSMPTNPTKSKLSKVLQDFQSLGRERNLFSTFQHQQ